MSNTPRELLLAFLKETLNRAMKAKDPNDFRTYTQCACDLYEALSVDGDDGDDEGLPRRVESND